MNLYGCQHLDGNFIFFWGGGARDQLKQQVIEGVHQFQRQMLLTLMYKQNNHS